MNLNEILNTIDNMISKMWDKKHEKERIDLFGAEVKNADYLALKHTAKRTKQSLKK